MKVKLRIGIAVILLLGIGLLSMRTLRTESDVAGKPEAAVSKVKPLQNDDRTVKPAEVAHTTAEAEKLLKPGFTVTPISGNALSIRLEVPTFQQVKNPAGFKIKIDGQSGAINQGGPDVASSVKIIEGREGMLAKASVQDTSYTDYPDIDLAPGVTYKKITNEKGETVGLDKEFLFDDSIYGVDAFWPGDLVETQEASAGERKLVRLQYNPIQYNPVTKTLRHHKVIESELLFIPESAEEVSLAVEAASTPSGQTLNSDQLCDCAEDVLRAEDMLPQMVGNASNFAGRHSGAEVGACIKISTDKTGIYKITRQKLVDAGVNPNLLVGNQLKLYNQGVLVNIYVNKQTLFTSPNDYFLFYAREYKGYYDDKNAYWLGFGPGDSQMIERSSPFVNGNSVKTDACHQETIAERNDWVTNRKLLEVDDLFDGWFSGLAANIGALNDADFTFHNTDHAVPGTSVRFEVRAYGRNKDDSANPDHGLRLKTLHNNASIFSRTFDGIKPEYITRGGLNTDIFKNNSTTTDFSFVTYNPGGGVLDLVDIDESRLTFDRYLFAVNNRLPFGASAGTSNFRIKNFTGTNALWLFDVTDPFHPQRLTDFREAGNSSNRWLEFGDSTFQKTCYFATSGFYTPAVSDIEIVKLRNLADESRQARYIVIMNKILKNGVEDLLAYRATANLNNLKVLVVTPEEVFNEFSYGIADVRGIKQFIGYAWHHWATPRPRYVVLAGDSTYDPLNNEIPDTDLLMTPFTSTSFGYTSSDQWYGAINGNDNLVDLGIGRFPVNNVNQLNMILNKITAYEPEVVKNNVGWNRRAHFVADNGNAASGFTTEFQDSCENIRNNIFPSGGWNKTTGYLNASGSNLATINNEITQKVNTTGIYALHYEGHGAPSQWMDENAYDNGNVTALNNSIWPMVGIFTCINGVYFVPGTNCMVENFLRQDQEGAIACVAPTGQALSPVSFVLAKEYYNAMLNNKHVDTLNGSDFTYTTVNTTRIGDAFQNGLNAVWMFYGNGITELLFYNLFGDPALRIK